MALDISPDNLFEEVRAAEDFRDQHLKTPRELQQRFAGFEHSQDKAQSAYLENQLLAHLDHVSVLHPPTPIP